MKNYFFFFFKFTYGIIFSLLMVLILFFSNCAYACKKEFLLSNIEIAAIIAVFYITFVIYNWWTNNKKFLFSTKFDVDRIILVCSIILFILQCYVFYNIYFTTDWDAREIAAFADIIMNGKDRGRINHYFSIFPNNLLISYIYLFILKLNQWIGIFTGDYILMSIVVVNCAINSISCWLTYKTAKIFTSSSLAVMTYVIAVFSFGISGWSVICYSDSLVLFCPILCTYLYCRKYKTEKTEFLGSVLSCVISAAGYFIKPQCLFLFIAVLIIEIAKVMEHFSFKALYRPVILCLSALFVFLSVNYAISAGNQYYDIQIDSDKTYGIAHFLMMGANEEKNGVYLAEDVDFSASFETNEQRTKANISVFKERIKNMKSGVITHIKKKMLTTFNDGTFAWGQEGTFFVYFPENINSKAAPLLKSVYCGDNNDYLSLIQHFVWIFIMFFSWATFTLKNEYEHKWEASLLWIVLLGFVLYELLFEVRARYLYIFVPMMCVMTAIGFESLRGSLLKIIRYCKNR